MEIMSASKLDSLSTEKSRLFQELLPELVKRLIIDSSKSLSSIRIPSKDDIWAPGFDGIIENDEKNTYVSSGKSVWEFGTNNDSLTKINDDYEKRTINSLGIDKKETTFYLVIPKIWAFKGSGGAISEWENNKNDWKEVHLYDASVLCDWINSRPAVAAWLMEKLFDDTKFSFETPSKAWNQFSQKTNPPFTDKMFLLKRDVEIKNFLNCIERNEIIKIKSNTFIDSYGFCLASILISPDLLNTVIVINDEETYKTLSNIVEGKIFLLSFMNLSTFDERNKTIICYSQEAVSLTNVDIKLTAFGKNQFIEALKDMGIDEGEIEDFYFHTHGEIFALIRRIPGLSNITKPNWSPMENTNLLVSLLFLRAINITNDTEKRICELLVKDSFDNILRVFDNFVKLEASPIKKVESIYSIASYEETWNVLQLNIDGPEFKRLTELISFIIKISIGNIPDDLKYIHKARLLNILSFNLLYFSYSYPYNSTLNAAIKNILENIWLCEDLWESLSFYAEINPKLLLDIFEEDINGEDSNILCRFQDGTYHSKYWLLLSAIQKLTQFSETKVKACMMLFDLCKIESNYCYNGNTPEQSLLSTLCLWSTEGELSITNKKDLALLFIDCDNNYGLSFCIDLIQVDSISSGRTIGVKHNEKHNFVSIQDYKSAIVEIETKIIETVIKNKDICFLPKIIDAYEHFPPELIEKLLSGISSFNLEMINKIGIGYNIRQIIYRIKLFKITDEKIYADIFTTHIKNVEEEYYDDCLFAFLGNYYDCPIIDAPFLNEKESLHSEKERYFFEYRISVLNMLFRKNRDFYLKVIIDLMEDSLNWGILLAYSDYSSFAIELSKYAIIKGKYKIISGLIDGLDLEKAKSLLELPKEIKEVVISHITRQDILPFINDKELLKMFWSNQTMYEYSPFMFEQLIKYNPSGLLYYYSFRCNDIINQIENVIQVLIALTDAESEINQVLLNELIQKIDNNGFYSDEYAELCMGLSALYKHHSEFHNYFKEYYYRHPEKLNELMTDERAYWNILSYYQLQPRANETIENIAHFFDAILQIDTSEAKYKAYSLFGVLLGSLLKSVSIDNFIEKNYISLIEQYYSNVFEKYFIERYFEFVSCRWIGDGSDQKQKGDELSKYIDRLEIQYPNTTQILRKLICQYDINAKSDYIHNETNVL